MKAILFIPSLDRGGPDRVFFELAQHLPAFGIDTEVLVQSAGGHYWDQLPATVRKSVLGSGSQPASAKGFPMKAFAAYVDSAAPDVVICTLRSLLTATTAKLLGLVRVPLVIRPANHVTRNALELLKQSPLKHSLSWLLNIASLHVANHVICQSQDLHDDFRRYGVPAAKLTIIGNPINIPSDEQVAQWRSARTSHVISLMAVGRLMPQKGFDILVRAFARVKDRLPGLRLTVLGEGEDRVMLEQLSKACGVEDRVSFPGFSKQVLQQVATADFLVSSSRYEGFPNVVLEALSCGVPAIATNCPGGTREIVIHGQTGWLCQPESDAALAEAILAACEAQPLSPRTIREFVIENYASHKVAERYATVLKKVIPDSGR